MTIAVDTMGGDSREERLHPVQQDPGRLQVVLSRFLGDYLGFLEVLQVARSVGFGSERDTIGGVVSGTHVVNAGDQAAGDLYLLVGHLLGRAPTDSRKEGVHDAVHHADRLSLR